MYTRVPAAGGQRQTEQQFSLDRGSSLVVRDNGSLEGAVVFGVFDAVDHGLGT
jgi:hypothetical protein